MDQQRFSRRGCLQAATVGGLSALSLTNARPAQAAVSQLPELSLAGYAYDRVRAIQDGRLKLDGFDVNFHPEDIYTLNKLMFGPQQTYAGKAKRGSFRLSRDTLMRTSAVTN